MICDKAVMSRLQVAPPPPPPPPSMSPLFVWKKNGSTVSSSQRTFISPHLCGLGHDDLGFLPSQPSCHLWKKEEGEGQHHEEE